MTDPSRLLPSGKPRRPRGFFAPSLRKLELVKPRKAEPKPPKLDNLHFLAKATCWQCKGTGYRARVRCTCILRRLCRMAIGRFHEIGARGPHHNAHVFSRDGEYVADLWNIAERNLDPDELRIFRDYLLTRKHPWTRFAKPEARGQFFHAVYRTEEKFGAALIAADCLPECYFAGIRPAEPEQIRNKNFYWMTDSGAEDEADRLDSRKEFTGETRDKAA